MNSFSDYLILVYRKTTCFCKLILHPATLLNVLIIPSSFLVEFWGSLMYNIVLSANRDNLTSSFPISGPLISFYLIVSVRVSSTILKSIETVNRCNLYIYFKGVLSSI